MCVYELPIYGQYLEKYLDGAFINPTDINLNNYSLFKKSDKAKQALNQKALDFMQEKKLFFRMFADIFLTGLGYSFLDNISLYYVGKMLITQ